VQSFYRPACAIAIALSFSACRAEPPAEGIRPETTARSPAPAQPAPVRAAAAGGESWNAAQIDWQPYEAGLAQARAQNKPVCLVLYTNWCPHCRNYSRVFEDPQVVERARGFVMIRANADEEPAVAGKYTSDGGYVPRTFFLAADGTLDPEIHAPRPKFRYFYDERDPRSLLGGMETAARTLVR
jgi:protein-disulfide reductase (glutathione)